MKIASFFIAFFIYSFVNAQLPNGKILFSAQVEGKKISELYTINLDGTSEQQLTNSHKTIEQSSSFNNKIAYLQRDDSAMSNSIVIADLNGKVGKTVMFKETVCNPRGNPKSNYIAYEFFPKNTQEIWLMDSTGSNMYKLIANARHPYWSGNGTELLFTQDYEIHSRNMINGKERQLTHLAKKNIKAKWPAIAPNGSKLAFVAYTGTGPMTMQGIMILDLKTNKLKTIADCSMPCWTSNNDYIIATCSSSKYTTSQIALININTGFISLITKNTLSNDFPVWIDNAH